MNQWLTSAGFLLRYLLSSRKFTPKLADAPLFSGMFARRIPENA